MAQILRVGQVPPATSQVEAETTRRPRAGSRKEAVMGVSGKIHTKEQLDDYANQHNPNNDAYQANLDNHSNQLNPNNPEYWNSRGEKIPEISVR
jgi:hypothetical protein